MFCFFRHAVPYSMQDLKFPNEGSNLWTTGPPGKSLCLTFKETVKMFSEGGLTFSISISKAQGSNFSAFLPTLGIVYLFDYAYSCLLVSQYNINLHFPNDVNHFFMYLLPTLYILHILHQKSFNRKYKIFCLCFNWVSWFLTIEL